MKHTSIIFIPLISLALHAEDCYLDPPLGPLWKADNAQIEARVKYAQENIYIIELLLNDMQRNVNNPAEVMRLSYKAIKYVWDTENALGDCEND